jgi:hypothetical protein
MKHKFKYAMLVVLVLVTGGLAPTALMAQSLSAPEILALAAENSPTSTEYIITMSYEGWNEDTDIYAASSLSAQGVTVNGESYINYTLSADAETLNVSMVTDRTGMYFQGEDGVWYGQAYDGEAFTFESQLQQMNFDRATIVDTEDVNGYDAYVIVGQVSLGELEMMAELWIDVVEYLPLKTRMTSVDGSAGEIAID